MNGLYKIGTTVGGDLKYLTIRNAPYFVDAVDENQTDDQLWLIQPVGAAFTIQNVAGVRFAFSPAEGHIESENTQPVRCTNDPPMTWNIVESAGQTFNSVLSSRDARNAWGIKEVQNKMRVTMRATDFQSDRQMFVFEHAHPPA
ncbi:hypothetical protein BU15DRAFT_63599 [Melanogaster broomeanus]|nr:hypothetical protein BU15DRAFT_63599 [Melanogaster broomeanus]